MAPLTTLAASYRIADVPNVNIADSTRFVSNPDGILSPEAQAAIDASLRRLMGTTTAEVAVVAVDDIDASYEPDDFATELFRSWGLGKRDNENGLLILVVKDRRKVVIRTGYGLEGILPDGLCGSIIRSEILTRFREGDFDRGTVAGVNALTSIISDPAAAAEVRSKYANNSRASKGEGDQLFQNYLIFSAVLTAILMALFLITLIGSRGRSDYDRYRTLDRLWTPTLFCSFLCLGMPLVVLLPLMIARKHTRRGKHTCPNCGTRMNLVDEEHDNDYLTPTQDTEERINSIDYDVWLCPNCGTTEILPYVQRGNSFSECPYCHARALELVSDRVMRRPTVTTEGVGVRTYRCRHCKRETHQNYSIAKLPPVVVIPGGRRGGFGGGSFGGGSFGGGSTGGGGASGGW
ncbi:MAG: TPM domain-containing protein [Muribaculaceae bacterium]|nr:TPM domain-containing protein [Muribaculaceae bacterium]